MKTEERVAQPPLSTAQERLERLEGQMQRISDALARLDARVSAVEGITPVEEPGSLAAENGEVSPGPVLPEQGAVLNLLTQVGRSCLVLGGAFLIRSLTDSGTLPRPVGAALGLAYAVLWILLADRSAGRGRATSGAFLGITAVVIAYPLIAETSTRFGVLTPTAAAAALAALTGLCLAVGWRRNLPALAWVASFAAVLTAFALSLVTGAVEPFAATLLAIGLATVWLGYGHRHWHALRWPMAAAADVMVLWTALRLMPSESPAPVPAPSLSLFFLLAFALPFLYMGSFALRTLAKWRDVTAFEVAQTVAALAVGFGGAAAVASHVKDAQTALGVSALVIAAGCYGIAFVFVERQQGHVRNFHFYATLALLLMLSGSALAAGGAFLGFFWCALALASAILAARFHRVTLAMHSAAYAAAAAWQTGLVFAAFDSFVAPAAAAWAPLTASALCAIATAAACYALLAREEEAGRAGQRLLRAFLAVLVAFGVAALAVGWLRGAAGVGSDSGGIAALRTAILAVAALLLAAARGRARLPELTWLAYAMLVIGAAKLLVEDLPRGRPATLFVAFAFYGTALIVAARLLRSARRTEPG